MTTQYLFYILFGYLSGSIIWIFTSQIYKEDRCHKRKSGSESGGGKCISLRWSTDRILCIDAGTSEGISAGACGNACVKSATPYFWFGVGCTGSRACVSVLESDGRKVNCSIIWSIARVSPLLETGFDFGGMLFDVFYCDCHSASLFPVCCHIRNFLGNGDNQEGTAWNHSWNRDFVLCSDLEASCKVSK